MKIRRNFGIIYLVTQILTILSLSGFAQDHIRHSLYTLVNDDGIFVEQFDSTVVDENRFTENNVIFKTNKIFEYDYKYISPQNKVYYIELLNTMNPDYSNQWTFIPVEKKNGKTITKIRITVKYGLQGFDKMIKGYNQTIIEYKYFMDTIPSSYIENTGVIENEKNIWMHPPRAFLFKVLEINPFPFISSDATINWNWNLKIGENWGDSRWLKWSGAINNQMSYKTVGTKVIKTNFGKIKCKKIVAEAISSIGKTALTFYFSNKYGFVELDYKNIDGSAIVFKLKTIL